MRITEVRIKLMEDASDRLCAFCSITLDECFVIRDLKIIQGSKGAFVAMPSRKLTDRCPKCHYKNHLRAAYCNQCGIRLHSERALKDEEGRAKLYADIAHPINSECRDQIQQMVISAYEEELVKSQQEGYICTYDDFEEDRFASLNDEHLDHDSLVSHFPAAPPQNTSPQQPAPTPAKITFETEQGKVLRVDPPNHDQQKNRDHEAHRETRPETLPAAPEKFGEGII